MMMKIKEKYRFLFFTASFSTVVLICVRWNLFNSFDDTNGLYQEETVFNEILNQTATRDPSITSEQLSELYERRKQLVDNFCSRRIIRSPKHSNQPPLLSNSTPRINASKLFNIYVDDKHGFLYCKVPKVGCTTWKRILLKLTGALNDSVLANMTSNDVHHKYEKVYLRTLDSYTEEEILFRLKSHFKVIFVRHPFERLVSAFENKFKLSQTNYFPARLGRLITSRYRRQVSSPSESSSSNKVVSSSSSSSQMSSNSSFTSEIKYDITFEEFLLYLLDTPPKFLNEHWQHYHELCQICKVGYDFVGKYETFRLDSNYVLRKLGVEHLVSIPPSTSKNHSHRAQSRTDEMPGEPWWLKAFSGISRRLSKRLWEKYYADFTMFGYPPVII